MKINLPVLLLLLTAVFALLLGPVVILILLGEPAGLTTGLLLLLYGALALWFGMRALHAAETRSD